jgi:hypothetical protein
MRAASGGLRETGFCRSSALCINARVSILSFRAWALWFLGYPEAALVDANDALKHAREIGQAATLMVALHHTSFTHIHCGNYGAANAEADELVALTDEKGAEQWRAGGMLARAWLFAATGKTSDAVQMLTSGIAAWRSTGPYCAASRRTGRSRRWMKKVWRSFLGHESDSAGPVDGLGDDEHGRMAEEDGGRTHQGPSDGPTRI